MINLKRLILKKLVIISKRNEEAKIINFDDGLNIITGDNTNGKTINRTGKSLVVKSIYYAFGAKLNKYTANWNNLEIITSILFNYKCKDYELYRFKDRFLLKTENENKFFVSIAELRDFYVTFFDFYLKMPIQKDKEPIAGYPGCIFMPFYIDQDKGWSGSWNSFADVFSGKWKSEIILYHMGIRSKEYYDLQSEKTLLGIKISELKQKIRILSELIEKHIKKYDELLIVNIDISEFETEINSLTTELNSQLNKKNKIKDEILRCFNDMKELEDLYKVTNISYNELLKDVEYIENNIVDEIVVCPICGCEHQNSVENRFHIYSEVEECEDMIRSYFEEREKIAKRLKKAQDELNDLETYVKKVNDILNSKKQTVTLNELIISEGSKTILLDMREEKHSLENEYSSKQVRVDEISKVQKDMTKKEGKIVKEYLSILKSGLSSLHVVDIDQKDLEKIVISFKSGGNDLSSAILVQVFTIYKIASKYSSTVCPPIVLDAIFQQEPAPEKIERIWKFILEQCPEKSQLIISTTELHNNELNANIIRLTNEKKLLCSNDYAIVAEDFTTAFQTMLNLQESKH